MRELLVGLIIKRPAGEIPTGLPLPILRACPDVDTATSAYMPPE